MPDTQEIKITPDQITVTHEMVQAALDLMIWADLPEDMEATVGTDDFLGAIYRAMEMARRRNGFPTKHVP